MARILIADDRESMRMAVKTVIRMHPGWEVCGEADDGREAVTKALELRPDLVLLDFRMPTTNGIKAGSAICSALPRTPVVMYTLHRTDELEVAAKLVGIRQVVAKEEGPDPRNSLYTYPCDGRTHWNPAAGRGREFDFRDCVDPCD